MTPKISVIMPAYNADKFIDQAIASLVAQSLQNWELLVFDDASKDNTREIIEAWAEKDNRIRPIFSEINLGPAVGRNRCIEEARGRYLAFLDADDRWYKEKLRRQSAFMEETGAVVTFTEYDRINDQGQVFKAHEILPDAITYQMMLKRNWMGCLTVMVDRDAFEAVRFPYIQKRQDYALWMSLIRESDQPALCLHQNLASHRSHDRNISGNKVSLLKYNYRVFRHHENLSRWKSGKAVLDNVFQKLRGPNHDKSEMGMLKRTAFWMAILSVVSRFLGFFREVLIAKNFGSGASADSYFLMASVVSFLWLFSGVFGNSMIPLLIEIRGKGGDDKGLILRISQGVLILYLGIVSVMFAFAPHLIRMIAYGFSAESQNLTIFLFRIGIFSIFFSALFDIYHQYLKSEQLFLSSNFSGILFNLSYVVFFFVLPSQWRTIEGLSVMMIVGSASKLLALIPYMKRLNFKWRWMHRFWEDENFKRVLVLGMPIFFGTVAFRINGIVDKILATPLPTGSVSSMNYAYRLISTYQNLVLTAFLTLLFPTLTRIAQTDLDRFRNAFDKAMRIMIDLLIPSAVGMVVLARPIVTVVYRRGAFGMDALDMTTDILQIYAIGLLATGVSNLFIKGFYANQETRIPSMIGIFSVCVNITFDFILVGPFGIQGLAAATVIASFASLTIRSRIFYRTYGSAEVKSRFPALIPPLVASGAMAAGIWQVQKFLGPYYLTHLNLAVKLGGLIAVIAIGAGIYLVVLRIFNPPEWNWLFKRQ